MVIHLMQAKKARITNLTLADGANSWKPQEEVVKEILEYLNANSDVLHEDA